MSAGRNFLINLGGNVIGLVLFAILTPVYFHAIGAERYGVLTVVLSLSMYVSTFNFGMGPALTYRVAGDLNGDIAAQSEAFWSAMAFSAPIGLVASVIIFGLLPIGLADLMHLSPVARHELRGAMLPLVGIGLCMILNSNIYGVWAGRQAFFTLAVAGSIDIVMTILAPVLTALYISTDISTLLYATFAARITSLSCQTLVCFVQMFEQRRPSVSLARIRSMLSYGGWVTLSTLVETVVSSADRLVLGTISGAGQIALYSIPLSITSRAMMLPLSLLSSIFPRLINAEKVHSTPLLNKAVRFLLLLTPGYVFVAASAAPLLRYWMSPDFADKATFSLQIMAAALWVEGISASYYYQLNARGNTRANFITATTIIVPYVASLALGAWLFGATGVAAAYLLRNFLIIGLRGYMAKVRLVDTAPVAINMLPFVCTLLLVPHDWTHTTAFSLAIGMAATLLSIGICLWTRPHDFETMVRTMIPARFARVRTAPL